VTTSGEYQVKFLNENGEENTLNVAVQKTKAGIR